MKTACNALNTLLLTVVVVIAAEGDLTWSEECRGGVATEQPVN